MRETEVAIVGAGLAGALAATMLGRAGYSVVLIDPFDSCRPDFRAEKLEAPHIEALRKAGVLDEVLPAARHYRGVWVARLGRLAEVKPIEEYGIDYSALVNRLRSLVPPSVTFVQSKVTAVALSDTRQTLTLSNGEQISARLVIGANGVMPGLIGARREISPCHSVSVGFDVEASHWPFEALTYFGEDPALCVAYLTLFPLAKGMRANLFVYRALNDPWFRRLRDNPSATIAESLPSLARLTGALRATGPLKVRPVDLVATGNAGQSGIVLVGDAFATACPVSGTGAAKALIDTERLCNVYIPVWLASEGMGASKIAEFYDDPEKRRFDEHSFATSIRAKRVALGTSAFWRAVRRGYYAAARMRHFFNHGTFGNVPSAAPSPVGVTPATAGKA